MKTATTIIFLLTSLTILAQQNKWVPFEKALDNYLAKATHDNSVKAYNLLPDKIIAGDYASQEVMDRIFSKVDRLETTILESDRDAVRLAFKLFTIADGGYAEGLQIEIGKLINVNPKLFLQELKNHRHLLESVEGVVCNFGPDYVDDVDLETKETEMRLKSLNQVGDKDLLAIRDECLTALDRQAKRRPKN